MRYAAIKENDIVDGEGVCVALFVQGCPHRCYNCFNPETWDFNGGTEIEESELITKVISLINKNDFQRNLSLLGGDPLAEPNRPFILTLVKKVRETYPSIKIFLWTGYTLRELRQQNDTTVKEILKYIDVMIDGRYVEEQRDITLHLRGSRNQRILKRNIDF